MNAFEFVKKYGLNRATEILQYMPEGAASFDFINIEYSVGRRLVGKKHIRLDLVKRIVESHELVEFFDGISEIKDILSPVDGLQLSDKAKARLKQAIADVEACS